MEKQRKAFITGAEGFVGGYLCRHLGKSGIEVHGSCMEAKINSDFKTYKLDILDKAAVKKCILKINPDYIFHLAAQSSVKLSWKDPKLTKKVNVEGTRNVMEAAKMTDAKVLIVSSAEVYGTPKKTPITEEHPLEPQNPYAESKLEAEIICKEYDIPYFISRSFTHIGPGQQPIFFCSEFAKTITEIEKGKRDAILRFGDKEIVRDLTDVRDVVRAYLLMLEKGKEMDTYNVCSGKGTSIGQILDILCSLSHKKIRLEQDKTKLGAKSIRTLIGSNEKFSRATGWKPEIALRTTLLDMLEYWRQNI